MCAFEVLRSACVRGAEECVCARCCEVLRSLCAQAPMEVQCEIDEREGTGTERGRSGEDSEGPAARQRFGGRPSRQRSGKDSDQGLSCQRSGEDSEEMGGLKPRPSFRSRSPPYAVRHERATLSPRANSSPLGSSTAVVKARVAVSNWGMLSSALVKHMQQAAALSAVRRRRRVRRGSTRYSFHLSLVPFLPLFSLTPPQNAAAV